MENFKHGISKGDLFKNSMDIGLKDDRWNFGAGDSIEEFHEKISRIEITSEAPRDVIISFEAAKNTMLYSYFSYRLSTPALSFAFSTLEMALKRKLEIEKQKLPGGLNNKLVRALDLGWLDVKKIMVPTNLPLCWDSYVRTAVIPYIRFLRNDLAHDPVYLNFPYRVLGDLSMIARIINMLYLQNEDKGNGFS